MDKFTQLASDILKQNIPLVEENNEIMVHMQSEKSFGDFLRSLTGKTIKDVLDSGSYARLFSMNMHGIGGNKNSPDEPAVLLSRFLTKFGDYVNQDITNLRSGEAETDEFKHKHDYEGHLEREKERKDLFREIMAEKDPEKKSELRQKMNAFRNNSQYAEARRALYKKEDVVVDEFHNSPIKPGQLVNDGSDEFKELEDMYNKVQSMRGSHQIEDQEQPFLDKGQQDAIKVAQTLANDPTRRLFQKDPQKEINKAYGDVMKKIANKIKSIQI
tara:strand:- start:1198 stop:2013 length:816 start_codon:yes stop_codon:yes gene_type:complete